MEILPVTSNGPDIILGPTPTKPRAIALKSVRQDWLYSSNSRKIHELRGQGMEELPLTQPNCCYWSVGWCLGLGGLFSLFHESDEIRACSITVGRGMFFSGSTAFSLLHRMQTGTPSIRTDGGIWVHPAVYHSSLFSSARYSRKKPRGVCRNLLK